MLPDFPDCCLHTNTHAVHTCKGNRCANVHLGATHDHVHDFLKGRKQGGRTMITYTTPKKNKKNNNNEKKYAFILLITHKESQLITSNQKEYAWQTQPCFYFRVQHRAEQSACLCKILLIFHKNIAAFSD